MPLFSRLSQPRGLSASVPVVGLEEAGLTEQDGTPPFTHSNASAIDDMCSMSHKPCQDGFLGLQSPRISSFNNFFSELALGLFTPRNEASANPFR